MKLFIKILLLNLSVPLLAFAQSNYKLGYVVNLKGDTVKGFIDYKEWDKNPVRINFKKDMGADAGHFSAEDISAFAITGLEYYEKYKVVISLAHVDVEKLPTGVDTTSTTNSIFLRLLVKGRNISLYEYKDDIKNRFYIKDNTLSTPEELIYRIYLNPNDVTQSVTQPRYQNQLQQLALKYHQGSDKLTAIIEKVGYNESDIMPVVNIINGSITKTNNPNKAKPLRFFAGAGINGASLKYSGNSFLALSPTSKASFGPRLTVGMDVFLNPNVGQLILRTELFFTTVNLQTSSNTVPYASQSFRLTFPGISPQLIYNVYNTESLKCYIGAGASVNLYTNSNNNYYYAENPYSPTKSVIKGYPNLASSGASFLARAGVVLHKKYELYLIYSPAAVVTDHYGSFSGAVTSMQAGVNYLFGTK
jgi:hypothetical protein